MVRGQRVVFYASASTVFLRVAIIHITYIQIANMHTKLKLLPRVCACTWSEFHGILNNHKNQFLESQGLNRKMSTPN